MSAQPPYVPTRDWKIDVAALLMLASGVIHFIIVPHHSGHALAHGLMMGMIGVIEVAWAVIFWRKPTRWWARVGVLLAVGFISLWVVTRIAPAPYTNEPEEVDTAGIVTKIMEGITAGLLMGTATQIATHTGSRFSAWTSFGLLLVCGILAGLLIYGLARATQPLFPQLGPPPMEPMENMPD